MRKTMMVCLVMLMAWTTAMGIKKPNTERWPDGAEIDAWFSDTSRVDVSGLKHYVRLKVAVWWSYRVAPS